MQPRLAFSLHPSILFVSGYAASCGTARWGKAQMNFYRRANSLLSRTKAGKRYVVEAAPSRRSAGAYSSLPIFQIHKRISCRGGAWTVLLIAWDNLQRLRWLFAVCSLALEQRRGLRDPSPRGGADRSWCIPDIFCLFVFHREGWEWARCSSKASRLSLMWTSYLWRSLSICSRMMNVLSVRNRELKHG